MVTRRRALLNVVALVIIMVVAVLIYVGGLALAVVLAR